MLNFTELENFINNHLDNWYDLLKKPPYNLQSITQCSYNKNWYVLVYNLFDSELTNPIVKECRGTIVEVTDKCKVICAPYTKFFNYGQTEADTIDWNTAKIREKIDGQLIKCFKYKGQVYWATNGSLELTTPITENNEVKDYKDLLVRAIFKPYNLNMITYGIDPSYPFCVRPDWIKNLPEGWTLMFELVSPYNRIVVNYPEIELWFHGARDAEGNEHEPEEIKKLFNLPYRVPQQFNFKDVATIQKYMENWKGDSQEGVVVCDANYHRVKIKCEDYLHYAYQAEMLGKKNYLLAQVFAEKDDDLIKFPEAYKICQELKEFINDVKFLLRGVHIMANTGFKDMSKKDVAMIILKPTSQYKIISDLIFKALLLNEDDFINCYINSIKKAPTVCYDRLAELYDRIKEYNKGVE